jgi:hypothetical protein
MTGSAKSGDARSPLRLAGMISAHYAASWFETRGVAALLTMKV